MEDFILLKYDQENPLKDAPAFYIRSHGKWAGEPSPTPLRYSYLFFCQPKDAINYYVTIFSLWQSGIFKHYMNSKGGDVIVISVIKKIISGSIGAFEGIQHYIDHYYNLLGDDASANFKICLIDALKQFIQRSQTIH